MYFLLKVSVITLLITRVKCEDQSNQEELEFIEMLRRKVHRLEQNGEIKRDYEPYTEPQLKNGGAGSSGSALVARLSENYKWKILLLEAGGEPDILADIPLWSSLLHYTQQNWKFLGEKENNVGLGFDGQKISYPRGKGLGGSSLINYMVFTRGAKLDYDKWANLGNPGWSYNDLLPIFERLENCTVAYQDRSYRGHKGPVYASTPDIAKSGTVFLDAAENAGYQHVDYNGKTNKGVSLLQANIKRGLRCSGERCYIKPIKNRRNLTIRLHSHVTKILIKNNTAYGVEFCKNGRRYTAYSSKEVVLSAGAISSPQILLLSGIGPTEQLQKFGIKPIHELPVGQTMLDHPGYFGLGFTFNDSIDIDFTDALNDKRFKQLYNEGTGVLTSAAAANDILFTTTPNETDKSNTDIEIFYLATHFSASRRSGMAGIIHVTDVLYNYTYKPYEGQHVGNPAILLLHPKSKGRVELRSANPFVHPKIYPGFFTDPGNEDIKTLIAGIREAKRIMQAPPFDKYDAKEIDKPVYGCQDHTYDSDDYWECALRHLASSVFHLTTTCKMGPANDPEAVVDNNLRVHGINNLRVVDASVIPVSPTGHTNVPAFMVGEKGADIIKTYYK
ncbi:hypothetical protein Trydic_g2507 [Trypoxylus dichotomus]